MSSGVNSRGAADLMGQWAILERPGLQDFEM